MKQRYITTILLIMALQLTGCTGTAAAPNRDSSVPAPALEEHMAAEPDSSGPVSVSAATEENNTIAMTLQAGGQEFFATLTDSETARAFVKYLPMTVQMADLNGQEKFYALPDNLPADSAERPSTIHSGDIFCWSGNTLVLFYNTFQNSYDGYMRLGTVDDPAGLAAALGSGSAEVTWSLTEEI